MRILLLGFDLGGRACCYCVPGQGGQVQLELRLSTMAKALREVFGKMPRGRIALETGMHSLRLSRLLTSWDMKGWWRVRAT